ncbi:alpha-glucan family phosphorylase [Thermosulfurimonas marina]|uniref:Alpha-glucan family phosphorylase n=1 Tax=Thermosulfurimonas marina TaxID=2047767 RepID=A0A6H1WTF0_9BACT|nr:alpha-glucan family phosphorylase [Thermosulfurimonas marina]QJA06424.1 alpha-glucan family phosphorylase [Thermosulfurimonas marina]
MPLEHWDQLKELVFNLWWSWNPEGKKLFRMIDPILWEEFRENPVKLLECTECVNKVLQKPEFLNQLGYVYQLYRSYLETPGPYCSKCRRPIAFFSPEYGLHHSLYIYAGGLGLLAGDILKEASDLDFPLVGIGFMYPQGYVRQRIRPDGWQEDVLNHIHKEEMPVRKVFDENGQWLKIYGYCYDEKVYAGVWEVSVGRIKLYLLDTDVEENAPWNREISYQLYTPNQETRLKQQIVLGFCGMGLLHRLGIEISGVHINEDYAALALVARLLYFHKQGLSFEEAREMVRETSLFTTHTPIRAAINTYPFALIEKQFAFLWERYELDREKFLDLGTNPQNPSEGFNSTILALRLARYANAVSRRHGEVSRKMWHFLWPERSEEEVPIDYVTNGVHLPTWIDDDLRVLLSDYLGARWLEVHESEALWQLVDLIPDEILWKVHRDNKVELLHLIKERLRKRWAEKSFDPSLVIAQGAFLDPDFLTLGFARRMTGYKRATLIFHNLERLKRILLNPERPVQIIFAGKAHPQDQPGKQMIQKIVLLAKDPELAGRIAFIEDYDQELAYYMVKGVDVWLNNPLPPLEACGTSGMKAAINGVLHLSILDGWWVEGYNGKNGWAFGEEPVEGDRDPQDAEALYRILEEEVVPLYYQWDETGIPRAWVQKMKEAMKSIVPRFCARRMFKEYVARFYQKIDQAYEEFLASSKKASPEEKTA